MNGFYVSMIFFGILLVLVSLLFIALDKRKVFNFTKSFDDKKQQLTEILNDAEQMIEELNKFSDYIVNQMDLKNEELSKNLKIAEDKVLALGERVKVMSVGSYAGEAANPAADGSSVQPPVSVLQASVQSSRTVSSYIPEAAEIQKQSKNNNIVREAEAVEDSVNRKNTQAAVLQEITAEAVSSPLKKKDKIIPLRNKYSEVIRLSQQGMESIDIARGLNMGKGEVELIIGLRSEQLQ
jgi:hypothetical protein